jgi:hypothetical protein
VSNQSLVLLPTAELVLAIGNPLAPTIRKDAIQTRDALVGRAQAIERVAGASSQQVAANMLVELTKALNAIEDDRKSVKRPFLDFGKKIDGDVTKFIAPLEMEKARINKAIKDFAYEQWQAEQAAKRKQEEELAKLAAERKAAELAAQLAATPKEAAKAEEQIAKVDLKAVETVMAPVPVAAKVEGVKMGVVLVVTVFDVHALYKAFPEYVKLEPRMREINSAIAKMAEADPNTPPSLPGCRVTQEMAVSSR